MDEKIGAETFPDLPYRNRPSVRSFGFPGPPSFATACSARRLRCLVDEFLIAILNPIVA